ncbi:MAG: zinc ABC transporter substrate-binding protein, partial [Clostridia bacterium]|nr:zinc ABC transporter substrate-binding protein [Clostridia bacterium]
CHEAFDYFANQYNLTVMGTIMSDHGEEPSVKELVETTDMVKETGVKIILAEPQYETDTADTIARETGAEIYMLDPIVTGDKNDLPNVYFDKMRDNTNTLIKAIRKD